MTFADDVFLYMSSPLSREAVVDSRTQAAALVGTGIGLWFLATLAFLFVGQVLLPPDDGGRVALVFVATVPVMAMLAFAVYSLFDVPPDRRLTAATLLVLPGMVLDAVAVTAFETVFTNMAPSVGSTFGGLLLLAYASVLLTGVVPLTYVGGTDETGRGTAEPVNDGTGERSGNDTMGEG
ncbi:hypothetical protein C2R22_18135 [Salinigranum rubrum]|uniref:Uncharacterized protein n=2 Tax=Salinigranum rubrum TaxID=755307 RepID=A0A2I8VN25_9EURY|nr:hypothetical protein C2R22_18135 [Salinigranum rubrum]